MVGWFSYCFTPTDTEAYYTHTTEPVDGNGAQNIVTVQSGFEPKRPFDHWPNALTNGSVTGPTKRKLRKV
jgi:hypothetical protein